MNPKPHHDTEEPTQRSGGIKRLIGFILFAVVMIVLTSQTPLGQYFHVDNISRLATEWGWRAPLLIILLGAVMPLCFLPRWPLCFVSGILYGMVWGTALATTASVLGAVIHLWLARSLLAPAAHRMLARFRLDPGRMTDRNLFLLLVFLRAFPLSNFVATNLLAGATRVRALPYVVASFIGMIPSSLMYCAWGKLMKKPSATVYTVAILSIVFIVVGTLVAQKKLLPWLNRLRRPEAAES